MRLLKYPLELREERLNAVTVIDNSLLLLSSGGHVIVWSVNDLVDTAIDKLSIKDLARKKMLPIKFNKYKKNDNDGNGNDTQAFFLCGVDQTLIVASDHEILKINNWNENNENSEFKQDVISSYKSPCIITDIKLDTQQLLLFVLCSNINSIEIFDVKNNKRLTQIILDKTIKPITLILDPSGNTFTILCSDRSIRVYQFNRSGNYKLIKEIAQYVHMEPLHYKITMPPQANYLPIINSIKGPSSSSTSSSSSTTTASTSASTSNSTFSSTSATTTVLLDRNNNYNVAATIVSPASNSCKVLTFSPAMYEKKNLKKNTSLRYNLLATSGVKDGTILVWNTKRMKPLFNALQVSETPINDMVWSNDGLTLFAVSNDNILYTFAFLPIDLGEKISNTDIIELRNKNIILPPLPDKNVVETDIKISEQGKSELSIEVPNHNKLKSETPTITDSSVKNITSLVKKIGKNKTQVIKTLATNPSVKVTQGSGMEFTPPSYIVPKDLKRKVKEEANGTGLPPPPKKSKRELEPMDFLDTGLIIPNISFSRIRLASPKIRMSFKYTPSTNKNFTMNIKNGSGNEQKPTIISLNSKTSEQDNLLFQDFIPRFITMCTSGKFFWACCSDDGIIYVYSDSGKKLLPPMMIGVPISFLEASGNYLLCVTSIGELYCWSIEEKKLKFPRNSVYPILSPSLRYSDDILTRSENITMCTVTANGVPLITLSNGDGYIFDKDMEMWLLVSDSWWAYGSQYWDTTNSSIFRNVANASDGKSNDFWNASDIESVISDVRGDSSSIVNYMERKTNDELNRKGRVKNLQRFARAVLMKEGFENMEEIVTLAHLENRLLVCLKLEETDEFSKLLVIYCVRLGKLGYTDRLDDVLQWLYNEGDIEKPVLRGKTRKELLKSVLLACANIRHVQRVTNNYATAIGLIEETI
ncbi:similar to Saccharomyces cerevisiae YOR038C HIR2 Subunit of the HIR complex, a nucleosome assembly complex involved in regulation of histone gene transcription [Maudiozyma barnettii]|uniref:Protein HIR n=1 Tax=Maudiozyma barnettii TaxID=61262 RepID=A0A8H2VIK4_9SACH|nr:Hir2p [Kazachstania barnettii]CAB4256294.1 similar to Saccharomyces cerevisiae YOR038C HIR2 Subunit of the HIR complex, a nucleosome assembly complex involved in regulation of histone gene transcription [Kazachstania barnettii]CAD1784903.1 similar to Saccharomyces cerevisiae YOR038C HIR2 Subunit of the HIR complex, a nucleosome assembly complex involved in regulation of histone gene transcription [Kazachstania barnettii]